MATTFPTTPLIEEWDGSAGPITVSRPLWPADVSGLGAVSAELSGSGAFGRPASSFNCGNYYNVDLGSPDQEMWMAWSGNNPGIEFWLRVNNVHDPTLVSAYTCRFPGLGSSGLGTFSRYQAGVGYITLGENRIAVRFSYERKDASGQWFRSYGSENWEFDENGLMRARHASINDSRITESERKFRWPQGRRPDDHPGLSDLGL